MPFARVCRGAGGDEDHRVARADDDGAVGLLGEPAGLDRDGSAADVKFRVYACVSLSLNGAAPASGVPMNSIACRRRAEPGLGCRYLRMPGA